MLPIPDDLIENKAAELIAQHPSLAPETARAMARELVAQDLGLGHHVVDEWRTERSRAQVERFLEGVDTRAEAVEVARTEVMIAGFLEDTRAMFPKHAHLFRDEEST